MKITQLKLLLAICLIGIGIIVMAFTFYSQNSTDKLPASTTLKQSPEQVQSQDEYSWPITNLCTPGTTEPTYTISKTLSDGTFLYKEANGTLKRGRETCE